MGDNLRIVMMNGGLGNQLYQYAFSYCLEQLTGETCLIDDSWFWNNDKLEHNGYELEKVFGLKLNLLSCFFSDDVWLDMIEEKNKGRSIPQQLFENDLNITMFAESSDYSFTGNVINIDPKHIDDEVIRTMADTRGTFYYHGYWVNSRYVSLFIAGLRKKLIFPQFKVTMEKDIINILYANLILKTNSIAVHIRRGDFVKVGRAVAPQLYKEAIEKMEAEIENAYYFIFSDEIMWCREHASELGINMIDVDKLVLVEENSGNFNNYIDMYLMSLCKNMIISSSSFGHWAYYLNCNSNVKLINV